jgi:hypothetical protein
MDGPPAQFFFTIVQTAVDALHPAKYTAICQALSVIKSVLWFVPNGSFVVEIGGHSKLLAEFSSLKLS